MRQQFRKLALLLLGVPVSCCAGCAIDSAGVLREIQAIQGQQRSGDLFKSLTSIARYSELAERVDRHSEDVVTEAYMQAGTEVQRASVVRIAQQNCKGDGRYVPLLCFVLQFDGRPENRLRAARGLGSLKNLNPAISKSTIVLLLGEALEAENAPHRSEQFAFCLEEFLRNVCAYPIPNAERVASEMRLDELGKATTQVVRSDPTVVRAWWTESGRCMARRRAFDKPPASANIVE